jgi:hypothetical protein
MFMDALRIALTGDFYAGKTTLARTLETHGWTVLDHTGMLKELGHKALLAAGLDIPLSALTTDKDHYREFLEEMGICIGWDDGFGIRKCLLRWQEMEPSSPLPVVVDTVRTLNQWRVLEEEDFTLIRLVTPIEIREQRAAAHNVSKERMQNIQSHLNQSLLPSQENEIVLNSFQVEKNEQGQKQFVAIPPESLANTLEKRLQERLTAGLGVS